MEYIKPTHTNHSSTKQDTPRVTRFTDQKKRFVPALATDPVTHLVCFSHLRWKFVYQRPQVFLGPVVKIDSASLPQGSNLHYLGMKAYDELPTYFGNWDVAIMPFAINEATRYISPTKTPEYLAAGPPVVSTPIRDVVRTYGGWPQVSIADTAATFEQALAVALANQRTENWRAVDAYLLENSWDRTWANMQRIIQSQLAVAAEQ